MLAMSIIGMNGADEAKWAKHYSSQHQILLVGEGDFSFSLSLARVFGSASNIVATSLDSYEVVIKKYLRARTNLELLYDAGALLLFGVDAMRMKLHPDLQWRKFDRIIYNFPHAGFSGKENDPLVINKHRNLVCGFFENATDMLTPRGQVHVSHKTTPPFEKWNIEELASRTFLSLLERVDFRVEDYPGYRHKRGDGSRPDDPFPLGECSTFKFINVSSSPAKTANNQWIFQEYFDEAMSAFGKHDDYVNLCRSVRVMLGFGFDRCRMVNPGNPLVEYVNRVEELRDTSSQRIAYLQKKLWEIDHL